MTRSVVLTGGFRAVWMVILLAAGLAALNCSRSTRPEPRCGALADTLAFGAVLVGETKTLALELRNEELIRYLLKPSLPSGEFALVDVDTAGITLGAVDTIVVEVRFSPSSTGAKEGRLSFPGSPCLGAVLAGRGETNTCVVEPDTVAFGRVELGARAERTFRVVNLGTLPLEGDVTLDCPEFALLSGGGPFALATGETLRVVLEHAPQTSGSKACVVNLGDGSPCGGVPLTAWPTRTWRVAQDGSGAAETVQRGIELAAAGDTVLVAPGRYYEDIDFLGKDVVVKSELGPGATVLDGSREDSSVVIIKRGETRAAVLEGFTITGGKGTKTAWKTYKVGGGVWISEASPTIRGNRIVGNHLDGKYGWGGGMAVGSTYWNPQLPVIEENLIEDNSSLSNGGGMDVSADAVIRRNIFRRNRAGADGGALWLYVDTGAVEVLENEFWENEAYDHGGGIEASHSREGGPFTIERNLFVENVARNKEAEAPRPSGTGGAISARGMKGWIRNNTFVGNAGTGLEPCSGGGLLLDDLERGPLVVTSNLITLSQQCGLDCRRTNPPLPPSLLNNLFWQNTPQDLLDRGGCAPGWESTNQIADPLFCDPANGDYRVASNSPALTGKEVIGAYSEPGCGPRKALQPSVWGRLIQRNR